MTLEDQAVGRILNRGLLLGIPWYTSMTGMVYGIGYNGITLFFNQPSRFCQKCVRLKPSNIGFVLVYHITL